MSSTATRIKLELATNTLRLTVEPPIPLRGTYPALLDLTTRGRLLGIELDDHYVSLGDVEQFSSIQSRTAEISVEVQNGGSDVIVPRRGIGWEVSYPIGNRCWRTGADGSLICELTSVDGRD